MATTEDRRAADTDRLVRASQRGDRRAFGLLVQRFQNAAYAVAVAQVRNAHDAEDLLQDALVTAYLKLGQLRDPSLFPGWLHSVVVSECRRWRRHREVESRATEASGSWIDAGARGVGPDQRARLAQRELWAHVHSLAEPNRSVALLYYPSLSRLRTTGTGARATRATAFRT